MAQLTVVDDTDIELAVLMDADTFTALPLVAMGPNRRNLLTAFAEQAPFDLTILAPDVLQQGWMTFLERNGALEPEPDTEVPTGEVGIPVHEGAGTEAAQAEQEATSHTGVPAERPADTDKAEDPPSHTVVVRCWNCNGDGTIDFGDDQPPAACNVCGGTGRVERVAA